MEGGGKNVKTFISLLGRKEYRNVFYKRLPFIVGQVLNLLLRREGSLYLRTGDIGGGLVVVHGFSTIVVAEKVGKNFEVYQNVTVGWGSDGKPNIGNNVSIYAGAVVAGKIRIGNNVRIAANSFVRQDVPDNSLVYGNPCVILDMTKKK